MLRRILQLVLNLFVVLALAGAISVTRAQDRLPGEALTNTDIMQMVGAKVSPEVIIQKIQTSRCHFDTTSTVLDELKYKGVPPEVLKAMIAAPYGAPANATESQTPPPKQPEGATRSSGKELTTETETADSVQPAAPAPAAPAEPVLVQTQPVTADLAEEITLGLSQRNSILSSYAIIRNTPAADMAQQVFLRLRATAAFNGVPNLPYGLEMIQRGDPNAFNTLGGHVFVTSGLAELIGDEPGLWAAVEAHEFAHNIYRHGYKKYVREMELQRQINYWRYRIALGDQGANWGLLAAVTAGKLLNNKLERDDENAADKLGMLMMVEAGFHPDFAINLFRMLKARTGEQSKFGALFSDHPRFITREEHMRQLYPEAIARFQSLWPDAAASPGGSPPIIATVSKGAAKSDKTTKSVSLQLSYSIHNARNEDVEAVFLFTLKGQTVPSLDPAFQGKNGALVAIKHFTPRSNDESGQLELTVPAAAVGTPQRKLKARGCLVNKAQILECGKEFDVSFPGN
jgi:Zn-dependent protease with chaperone function